VAERWRREALLTANRLSHGVESSTAMFLSMSVEIVQCILARSPRFLGCFAPRFALQICKIAGGLIVSPNRFKVDFRETVAVFTVHQLSVPGDPYEIFISLESMAVSDQSLQTCYPGQEAQSPDRGCCRAYAAFFGLPFAVGLDGRFGLVLDACLAGTVASASNADGPNFFRKIVADS
jgi:hypothetical protein